ncbi:MAG: hypothetical protein R3324_09610, partial [Halobacteriales archaeon]|nr:hypothetical protein [Halobacteriales archaeon]
MTDSDTDDNDHAVERPDDEPNESVPKSPEQVIAEHEAQLGALLAKVETPADTKDVSLTLPGLDL